MLTSGGEGALKIPLTVRICENTDKELLSRLTSLDSSSKLTPEFLARSVLGETPEAFLAVVEEGREVRGFGLLDVEEESLVLEVINVSDELVSAQGPEV